MEIEEIEAKLLSHVNQPNYQPVKPKVIAKKLGITDDDKRPFKRALKRLIRKGLVRYGANHLVKKPSVDDGDKRITGRFQRNAKGFGFVRPSYAAGSKDKQDDIFIPQRRGMDAATGDLVLIRTYFGRGPSGDKRLCGEVVEIVERETHRFVGTYYETHGLALVQVDGRIFAQPISVGDPGAKNAQPEDKVVIEMVRFPSHAHDGEAVIVEVLGKRGEPGVDLLSIIVEYDLPREFPEEALEVAREQADAFDESIPEGRRDFTADTVITIDPIDARDFDDAISLQRLDNGHWVLGVHIADVSHFVPEGSALDVEARNRATSVYLPEKVIPMLPETISNNLASLQPDRVRYTRTAIIEFTPEGARVHTEVCKGAIRSKRRFAYEEVDEYLADREPWKEKLTPEVHALLGRMHELAMMLRKRRFARGSMELSMPEVKLDLNTDGQVVGAHTVENTESHQIIEEFMLAANEAVAEALVDRELFFLRRAHASPDPKKLANLTEFVRELGIECENLHSRFEIIRVLDAVKGKPEQAAVNYAVLRSMQKAVYSPEEIGHYALASDNYCHFTSPIRRYPDLTIHRMFDLLEQGIRPPQDFGQMQVEGEHCSEREQRAADAERELIKIKLLTYMSTRIGEEVEAVITGVEPFGLFVQSLDIPADGLVRIDSLNDDYYHYDAMTHSLVGNHEGNSFRLGDVVTVRIARVDLDRRELDYQFIEKTGQQSTKPPAKSLGGGKSGGSWKPKVQGSRMKLSTQSSRPKKGSGRGQTKSQKGTPPSKPKKEKRSKRRGR
ncbi:ribonuclease R [Blastopirellula marina]|uniref:Ribonuclease R n=1 Tax=Blastopirellula marina TaxID=124 RepID=A0A2S8GEL8_9BACT|nr:ribonuclease R [Blastopirellula marina]PQO42863.1 ribonuclease R [Blastopirellula marina]PTL46629.1 ribonuclease R [Blastopirellula marina]